MQTAATPRYFFDLGTSRYETGLQWFITHYATKGVQFDEIWVGIRVSGMRVSGDAVDEIWVGWVGGYAELGSPSTPPQVGQHLMQHDLGGAASHVPPCLMLCRAGRWLTSLRRSTGREVCSRAGVGGRSACALLMSAVLGGPGACCVAHACGRASGSRRAGC